MPSGPPAQPGPRAPWPAAGSCSIASEVMARIPKVLQEHINTAYPTNVCLIGTVLPDGYAQVTPRGSTMVFDDEHFATWERGRGKTTEHLENGTKVTVFFRK